MISQRLMRVAIVALGVMMLLSMVLAIFAGGASASSRIRSGSCDVWTTKVADPVAKMTHIHQFVGGMIDPLNNDVTGQMMVANGKTSCNEDSKWSTSLRWFPVAKVNGSIMKADKDTLYYRSPGDEPNGQKLKDIPVDLRLLSSEVVFKGADTTLHFPNCLKVNSSGQPVTDSADHKSHAEDKGSQPCDSSHPYRIPQPSFLIHWPKKFTTSTQISMGDGQWASAGQYMHGDYIFGNQPEFNEATTKGKSLIDLCLNDVKDSVDVASSRCGPEPN